MKANLDSILGKKYGKLTVIDFSHTTTIQQKDRLRVKYWFNCNCDCGNTTLVTKTCLVSKIGGTRSCGCSKINGWKISAAKQKGIARPFMQKPDGISIVHSSYLAYKAGSLKREIPFILPEEEFTTLTTRNCHYCNSEPKIFKKSDSFTTRKMNGIDRINSSLGYTIDNCVPCCKICNYMKQELSEVEFYEHMEKILTHRAKRKALLE